MNELVDLPITLIIIQKIEVCIYINYKYIFDKILL